MALLSDRFPIADPWLRIALALSLAMLGPLVVHAEPIFLSGHATNGATTQDYPAFYAAAKAALAGAPGDLYDPEAFERMIGAESALLWLYPPTMLLLLAPFGLFSYGAAKLAFVAITFAGAFGAARLAAGSSLAALPAAISPAVVAALLIGQPSAGLVFLLVAGLLLADKRPLLAGLCLALATAKPQYGLMAIPFLIATRAWTTIAAASAFSIIAGALSAALFGLDQWRAFFASLLHGAHADYIGASGNIARITLADALMSAGIAPPPAPLLYGGLFLIVLAGLVALARARTPRAILAAYAFGAGALASPYMFLYDYFIWNAVVLLVATRIAKPPRALALALAALWFAPVFPFVTGLSATPAILWPLAALALALLFCTAARSRQPRRNPDPHAGAATNAATLGRA